MSSPFTVAAAVLACVQAGLIDAERAVGQAMVAAGGLVIDDCCVGSLIVAPERVFRTMEPFPTEASADQVCEGSPIAVDLVVRVDRCVPVLSDTGQPPSVADQEAAFCALLADAAVVWNVLAGRDVLGSDAAGDPAWERASLSQLFVGAEGGCVGVETRVTFGVPSYDWCLTGSE